MTLNTVMLSTQRLTLKPFTANDADETITVLPLRSHAIWLGILNQGMNSIKLGVIG